MDSGKSSLAVIVPPTARVREIYDYDAKHRGMAQAGSYQDFLIAGIQQLAAADLDPCEPLTADCMAIVGTTNSRQPRKFVLYLVQGVVCWHVTEE
jgi:hypothetical protein